MPAPTPPTPIAAVPTTPDRNAGEDIFVPTMYTFLDYFAPFKAYLQLVVTYCADAVTWITGLELSASTAATTATDKAAEAAASAVSAVNAPGTNATSTSSLTPALGPQSFTLAQTGKDFVVGQFVNVVNSPTNYFNGLITAFNSGTGAMTVEVRVFESTGSASAWTVTPSTAAQGELFTAPVQKFVDLGTVSGTVNVNLQAGLKYSFTTSGNVTINPTLPSLATSSTEVEAALLITKGGTHSITWPVGTEWSDGAAPDHASGAKTEYVITKEGSSNWINSTSRKNIS